MADYTDYEICCTIDVNNPAHKEIVDVLKWMFYGNDNFEKMPANSLPNNYWDRITWGCKFRVFDPKTGRLHIISSDGVKWNPIPSFFEWMKPAILGFPGGEVGWYRYEADNVVVKLVL